MYNKFIKAVASVFVVWFLAHAPAYASINLQCSMDGVPHFIAHINLEDRVINVTFLDGSTDSAIILGQSKDGTTLYAKTAADGALVAFRTDGAWALSIDGGKSTLGGGVCHQVARV